MGSPFKMNPKTPIMKALVGKQKNLPEQLKQAILDSPLKDTEGKKTLSQVRSGQYIDIRDYTPEELITEVKKRGVSSAQIKKEVSSYKKRVSAEREAAKGITPNSGTQMGEILTAGPEEKDKLKKVREMQNKGGAGKSPAQMNSGKKGIGKAPNEKIKARIKRAPIGKGAFKPILKKKY